MKKIGHDCEMLNANRPLPLTLNSLDQLELHIVRLNVCIQRR